MVQLFNADGLTSWITSAIGSYTTEFEHDQKFHTCTLTTKIDGTTFKVKAQSRSTAQARRLALLHLVADLRARGVDETFYTPKTFLVQSPILEVWEHFARLGTVPSIYLHRPRDGSHGVQCTIRGDGVKVSSVSKKAPLGAFEAASARFLEVAALRVSKGEEGVKPIDSFNRLNRHSATFFRRWLEKNHKLTWTLHVNGEEERRCYSVHVSYSLWEGEEIHLPDVVAPSKNEGRLAIGLQLAVCISQTHPELLAEFMDESPQNGGLPTEWNAPSPSNAGSHQHTAKVMKPLKPASPTSLEISHTAYGVMKTVPDLELGVVQDSESPTGTRQWKRSWSRLTDDLKRHHSARLLQAFERYESETPASIVEARARLPVASYTRELIELVDNNVYSIFIGATGSGKTTQVPRIIFEEWCRLGRGAECNILCTQPRVIAATSVADRVGDELGPSLKGRVGFHVRNNSRIPSPRDGSITFCTTGILLQQIQHEPDFIFDNVTHLIIDEVHERDMVLDFTLTLLKRTITDRLERGLKVPRILLMSATLDEEAFARHFQNVGTDGELINAPSLSVPGRTFPVEEKYLRDVLGEITRAHGPYAIQNLRSQKVYDSSSRHIKQELRIHQSPPTSAPEAGSGHQDTTTVLQNFEMNEVDETVSDIDWDKLDEEVTPVALIAETIAHVLRTTKEGAVLVFLPGLAEIRKVQDILLDYRPLGVDITDTRNYRLFQLHSTLSNAQQTVFQPVSPGVRKIILSSPIAETSVTIPDVTVVIDSGQVRETQYDNKSRASWLRNSWINASSAKQRAGRAGRVQPGTYLALYSRMRRESLPASGTPEIMRSDLQSTCLAVKCKFKDVNVPDFLASAIDPPTTESVADAMRFLVDTGAFTTDHDLTPLGRLLSYLPIHPSLGKMIVMGIVFKCLDPIIIAGAAIEQQDLWILRGDNSTQVVESKVHFARGSQSDLIATHNAYCYIRDNFASMSGGAASELLSEQFLHFGNYKRIKEAIKAITDTLKDIGILQAKDTDSHDQRIGGKRLNTNSDKQHIVQAVLVAGLQSNIACRRPGSKSRAYYLGDRPDAFFAPSSMFIEKARRPKLGSLLTFGQLAACKEGYIMRHVNVISPLAAALFSCTLTSDVRAARSARQFPVFLANKFLPLHVTVQGPFRPSDRPTKKIISDTLHNFRTTLNRALNKAFDSMVRTQLRGGGRAGDRAGADNDAPYQALPAEVDHIVDCVVQVLDTDAKLWSDRARVVEDRNRADRVAKDPVSSLRKWMDKTGQRSAEPEMIYMNDRTRRQSSEPAALASKRTGPLFVRPLLRDRGAESWVGMPSNNARQRARQSNAEQNCSF
ncbi:unnamed protein product [Discula destructiva]